MLKTGSEVIWTLPLRPPLTTVGYINRTGALVIRHSTKNFCNEKFLTNDGSSEVGALIRVGANMVARLLADILFNELFASTL